MKKFLLGVAGFAVLGMSAPASAADLAVAPYKAAPTMIAAYSRKVRRRMNSVWPIPSCSHLGIH